MKRFGDPLFQRTRTLTLSKDIDAVLTSRAQQPSQYYPSMHATLTLFWNHSDTSTNLFLHRHQYLPFEDLDNVEHSDKVSRQFR